MLHSGKYAICNIQFNRATFELSVRYLTDRNAR